MPEATTPKPPVKPEHNGPHHPPGHDIPPHIYHELFELREKVGRLEGMMELFLKQIDKE